MDKEDKERADELRDEIGELREKVKGLEEGDAYDRYDEYLDELGDVKIGSLTYAASRTLKQIDEIAYNCGYNDWVDGEITELEEKIDELMDELKELEGD